MWIKAVEKISWSKKKQFSPVEAIFHGMISPNRV
jgi:hypothetical protein